jgi:hypothetical protein
VLKQHSNSINYWQVCYLEKQMVVEEAFWSYGYSTRDTRATFLRAIAEIESMRRVFTRSKTLSVGRSVVEVT